MKNIPLLIFDLICLPITVIRMILIYFFGSRYGYESLYFLDVMAHAENKYFNQTNKKATIDTITDDIRLSINYSSRLDHQIDANMMKMINKEVTEQPVNVASTEEVIEHEIINLNQNNSASKEDSIFIKNSDTYNNLDKYNNSDKLDKHMLSKIIKNKLDFMSFDVNTDTDINNASDDK